MQLPKIFTRSILFLILSTILSVNITAAKDVCAGESVILDWSSTNVSYCAPPNIIVPIGYSSLNATVTPNTPQSQTFTAGNAGGVFSLTCIAPTGASVSGSDSLNIENTPRCCGVGTAALEGRSLWNGSTCVRPVTTKPSIGDFLVSTAPGSATIASGWAFDPDTPAQSVNGHFYMDGPATPANNYANIVAAGLCSNPRPDMVQYFPGATPAFNSFGCGNYDVSSYCDNRVHTVYMYVSNADSTSWNLATTHTFSCAPAAGAGPTARLTAQGVSDVSVTVGSTVSYNWNSTNGVSYSSTYSSGCASGNWIANSASGNSSGVILPSQAGCVYAITYNVTGAVSANPSSAASTVTVRVCPSGYIVSGGVCSDGSAMSGVISASPASCIIPDGQSSCNVNLSWSTTNPVGVSGVTRDGTAGLQYNTNNGSNRPTSVPYESDKNVIYRLYNNTIQLSAVNVGVDCASSSAWDVTTSTCKPCQNGGCSAHICNNGSTLAPVCIPPAPPTMLVRADSNGPVATVILTCYNSNSYKLVNLSDNSTVQNTMPFGQFTISNSYTMTTLTSTVVATCSSNFDSVTKNVNLTNPALAPATFQMLSIVPAEQICGGGDVTVIWKIKDAKGKDCKITSENISKNPSSAAALPAVRASLAAATYKSLVNKTPPYDAFTVFEDQNTDGVSMGTVSGINIRYSTRFNVTCGGGTTGIAQTSKSVDVKVICRGQE